MRILGSHLLGNSLKGTPVSLKELIHLLTLWELASSSGLMEWRVGGHYGTAYKQTNPFLTMQFIKKRENSMTAEKALFLDGWASEVFPKTWLIFALNERATYEGCLLGLAT